MSVLEFSPMVVLGDDGEAPIIAAPRYEGLPVSDKLCRELGIFLQGPGEVEVPDLGAKVGETQWPIDYFDPLIEQSYATD